MGIEQTPAWGQGRRPRGIDAAAIEPPSGAAAPGWASGVEVTAADVSGEEP